jgi:cysteinyl-tRNA synthetase
MPVPTWKRLARPAALAALTFLGTLTSIPTFAQAPDAGGTVRAQNRDVTPGGDLTPGNANRSEQTLDFREEMRRFIQNISTYARQSKPDFSVLTVNGLDLLTKPLEGDETQQFPARAYLRSIDGVIQEGAFAGIPTLNTAAIPERRDPLMKLLSVASGNRLRVLTIDYVNTPQAADDIIRQSSAKGWVPFVSPERPLTHLPTFPSRPINENPRNIISLGEVQNYLYMPEPAGFGREDEYALALHNTNYDMLVLDVFLGRTALTRQAVETLKYKKLGAKRLVLARVNIGTAESYRYYWKGNWREGSPNFINAPYPANPDRYYTEFWRPEWQALISGGNTSYIYGIMRQGFDGVVLDGVEAYRFFEGTTQTPEVTF